MAAISAATVINILNMILPGLKARAATGRLL
jgi:hypothetical protein